MSLLNGEQESIPGGQTFDLAGSALTGGVAGYCAYRIIDLIQNQPPEWGVAAGGIGVIALSFAGLTGYQWRTFQGARAEHGPQSSTAEK